MLCFPPEVACETDVSSVRIRKSRLIVTYIWVCSTKVDMVCLSPVGYGVHVGYIGLLRRRANARNVS